MNAEKVLPELVKLLARNLRQWRAWGQLHSVSAEVMSADGPIRFTCGPDDTITATVPGKGSWDVTEMVER